MPGLPSMDDIGVSAAALAWLAWLTMGNPRRRLTAADRVRDEGSWLRVIVVLLASLGLALVLAPALPIATIPGPAWVARLVGAGVAAMGVAIREWAIRTLGPSFTELVAFRDRQPLVTSGPYRFVRHPGYAGSILTLAGLGLTLDNWASVTVLAVGSVVAHIPRIRVEERMLEDELADEYRAFERTRKRIIPGVW